MWLNFLCWSGILQPPTYWIHLLVQSTIQKKNWTSSKFKLSTAQETMWRECKRTSYKVEESIRKVHIRARAEGGELVSKLYKEISKHISKIPNKGNGQRAWKDISLNSIYRWQIKDVSHHELFGKCKLKPRCTITTHHQHVLSPNTDNNRSGWGHRGPGSLTHCWWKGKLVQPLWKTVIFL